MSEGYVLVMNSLNYRNSRDISDAKLSGQTGPGISFFNHWRKSVLEKHDWIVRWISVEYVSLKGFFSMRMEDTA